jgi:hypothetical protein
MWSGLRHNREWQGAILVFLLLLASYGYFFPRWAEWNQNSRMDLTVALVEQGRIQIDDYYDNTGDYALYGGHVYTDKAPGTSFLAVPAYAAFRALAGTPLVQSAMRRLSDSSALASTLREGGTGLLANKVYFAAALYAATFVTVSLPSALLGALLFLFMGQFLPSRRVRLALCLAYGLATVVFPYSVVLYGHQIAAALVFAAYLLIHRQRSGRLGGGWLALAGALLGLAVLVDFPALLLAAVLCVYALLELPERRWLAALLAGALPFALVLAWYNTAAFGSPLASSYRYLGRFPEIPRTGVMGFSLPSLQALWGITFSPYRGLFFMSPFLLLGIPGLVRALRSPRWRPDGILWLAAILAQLVFVSAWYDWRGGFAIGPRNLILMLPFLLPAVAVFLGEGERRQARVASFALLTLISFAVVGISAVSGQDFASIEIRNPLVEFFWPKFAAGDITRNLGMAAGLPAWYSLLPIGLLLALGSGLFVRKLR